MFYNPSASTHPSTHPIIEICFVGNFLMRLSLSGLRTTSTLCDLALSALLVLSLFLFTHCTHHLSFIPVITQVDQIHSSTHAEFS